MECAVWTLEGMLGDQPIRWSTAPLAGFEPWLVEPPGAFRYGLGDVVGVIERLSVTVTVVNDRGALDALALGSSEDGVDWEGPSLRDLRGRIYRYTGPDQRLEMTPPLVVSAMAVGVGTITLTLVADEHRILGPSAALATVEEWRQSEIELEWAHARVPGLVDVPEAELAAAFRSAIKPGNHTQIPWLYGSTSVRLQSVSEDGAWKVAGIVTAEHLAATQGWGDYMIHWLYRPGSHEPLVSTGDRAFPCYFRSSEHPGLLLAFRCLNPEVELDHRFDAETLTPVSIIRRILDDHAEEGAPYDFDSAARAEQASHRLTQVIGGAYADSATVEEVLAAIAPICGVEAYLHRDGRLHFAVLPSPEEEAAPVAELDPYDIFPGTTDHIPAAEAQLVAAPPAFGAVAGTISIDWPESLMEAYPIATGTDRRRASDAEGEVRLEGAWIFPPRASVALSAAADWYSYPIRLVSIPTHISILERVEPGDVIAFRAPTLPGGQRRLGMVRHIEVRPADETAVVTVGDLGWEGMIRTGVLDSFENWIVFEPPVGTTVQLAASAATITLSVPAFSAEDVGRRIWVRGASLSSNNRSYRITALVSANAVRVEPAPAANQSWTETGQRGLLVMRAADHPTDPEVIGGKIAVSDEPLFDNGERAYRFSR